MKRRGASHSTTSPATRRSRRGAGAGGTAHKTPTPGWKGHASLRRGWRNPRLPSVPATLELNLDEYFAAGALLGLLASQVDEPNRRWVRDWSFDMGGMMAKEARRRRRKASSMD